MITERYIANVNKLINQVRPDNIENFKNNYEKKTKSLDQLEVKDWSPNLENSTLLLNFNNNNVDGDLLTWSERSENNRATDISDTEMLRLAKTQSTIILDDEADQFPEASSFESRFYLNGVTDRIEHSSRVSRYLDDNLEHSLISDPDSYYSDNYDPQDRNSYYGRVFELRNRINTISNAVYGRSNWGILAGLEESFTAIRLNHKQELLDFRNIFGVEICGDFDDFVINFGDLVDYDYGRLVFSAGLVFSACIPMDSLTTLIDISSSSDFGHLYSVLKMSRFIAWSVQPYAYSGISLALYNKYHFIKLLTDIRDHMYP
jgi:hypothetical protein